MALLNSCTLAEALCMDSNFRDTIRLRLRGTEHARPTNQPLQSPICVSILESLVFRMICIRDASQIDSLVGESRCTQTEWNTDSQLSRQLTASGQLTVALT